MDKVRKPQKDPDDKIHPCMECGHEFEPPEIEYSPSFGFWLCRTCRKEYGQRWAQQRFGQRGR